MTGTTNAGVYLLAPEHAAALQRFASDPSFAVLIGVGHPPPNDSGAAAIQRATTARLEGTAYWSVVADRDDVKGVAAVIEPYANEPRVIVWIDPAARRKGYGSFALRMTLDVAFKNLQRERVHVLAPAGNVAVEKTVALFGFMRSPRAPTDDPNDAARYDLSRAAWIANRDQPALAALHPDLRAMLDAELAAGNQVEETGRGWPDADSVFVRLRDPFRAKPAVLPDGVVYTEPNDPHWWKADYTTRSPRHTLAC
jgi:RimJ/RimL family protein N-acetyltransferase